MNNEKATLEAMIAYETKNKEEAQEEMARAKNADKKAYQRIIDEANAVIEIVNKKLSELG